MEHDELHSPTRKACLAAVATAFLAYLLCAAAIHLAVRCPLNLYAALRSEKLLLMDQWNGRATSALFGSSHIHNGFDPRTFDQALAATALSTTTLNLGVEGGSQTEQRVLALRFVQHLRPHPRQACFVMLELNAGANFTDNHLVHPRAINIYDLPTLRFVYSLSTRSLGGGRAAGRILYAVAASALYYSNVGMLSNLIFAPPPDQQTIREETDEDRRGLLTPHQDAAPPDVVQMIASIDHSMTPTPVPVLPGNYDLISELQRSSPVPNVQFLYVVSPFIRDLKSYPSYPAGITVNGVTVPILSMARPDLYPGLYKAENWVDDAHLSAAGAAIFGRDLAAQVQAWYTAHPRPMNCGD